MSNPLTSVRALIGEGKVDEALESLIVHYQECCYDDGCLLHIKSQYVNLKKSQNRGIITREQSNLELNKITHALLSEIDDVKEAANRNKTTSFFSPVSRFLKKIKTFWRRVTK